MMLSALQKVRRNQRRKEGKRTLRGVRPNRSEAAKYNRELQKVVNILIVETNNVLPALLVKLQPEYTTDHAIIVDAYAGELNRAIRAMSLRSRNIGGLAETIAAQWANGVNDKQRRQFYGGVRKSIGVDLEGIVAEPGLDDLLEGAVNNNINLIQSLPDEYYKKITNIVNGLTSRKQNAKSIISELHEIGISTKKRARLIARDQTQKLNAAITQGRQEALGIEEYEWQISDDERVRESHKRNNGKVFRWDTPPKETGHPGEDINCRCVPLPIIDLSKTNRRAS